MNQVGNDALLWRLAYTRVGALRVLLTLKAARAEGKRVSGSGGVRFIG